MEEPAYTGPLPPPPPTGATPSSSSSSDEARTRLWELQAPYFKSLEVRAGALIKGGCLGLAYTGASSPPDGHIPPSSSSYDGARTCLWELQALHFTSLEVRSAAISL